MTVILFLVLFRRTRRATATWEPFSTSTTSWTRRNGRTRTLYDCNRTTRPRWPISESSGTSITGARSNDRRPRSSRIYVQHAENKNLSTYYNIIHINNNNIKYRINRRRANFLHVCEYALLIIRFVLFCVGQLVLYFFKKFYIVKSFFFLFFSKLNTR